MFGFFLVIKAEIVRSMIIMRRYWFATLTSLIVGYGVLMGFIVGFLGNGDAAGAVQDAAGVRFQLVADPEKATNAALGLIIGAFAFGVVGTFSQGLQNMARTGQLEQLCLSPHGLVTNFIGRSMVSAAASVVTSGIMLYFIATTVRGQLHLDVLPTVILLALTYFNLIGFGFMVGGLVLVFKQVGQIAVLLRMVLLFLAFVATEKIDTGFRVLDWITHALPVTDAAICLKYVLIRNQMARELDDAGHVIKETFVSVFAIPSFYFLLANCALWTLIGISLFKLMENWSRDKGTLGAY